MEMMKNASGNAEMQFKMLSMLQVFEIVLLMHRRQEIQEKKI